MWQVLGWPRATGLRGSRCPGGTPQVTWPQAAADRWRREGLRRLACSQSGAPGPRPTEADLWVGPSRCVFTSPLGVGDRMWGASARAWLCKRGRSSRRGWAPGLPSGPVLAARQVRTWPHCPSRGSLGSAPWAPSRLCWLCGPTQAAALLGFRRVSEKRARPGDLAEASPWGRHRAQAPLATRSLGSPVAVGQQPPGAVVTASSE